MTSTHREVLAAMYRSVDSTSILQRIFSNSPSSSALRRLCVVNERNVLKVGSDYTFLELQRSVFRLAMVIRERIAGEKVGGEKPVVIGVCFEACTTGAVLSMLASIYLGILFLPIDATRALPQEYPRGFLSIVIHDAVATSFVSELQKCETCEHFLEMSTIETTLFDPNVITTRGTNIDTEIKMFDRNKSRTHEPLYLFRTSGSTGTSKYVIETEQGLINRCMWQCNRFPFHKNEAMLAKTPLNFIDCMAEIFAPLLGGVVLCVLDYGANLTGISNPWRDPKLIQTAIKQQGISRLVSTPTLLREILRLGPILKLMPFLKYIHSSGEPLEASLAKTIIGQCNGVVTLINLYGSTEVSADVTYQVIDEELLQSSSSSYLPVGSPIDNCEIITIGNCNDRTWRYCEEGEIVVMGSHVSCGYINTHNHPYVYIYG